MLLFQSMMSEENLLLKDNSDIIFHVQYKNITIMNYDDMKY